MLLSQRQVFAGREVATKAQVVMVRPACSQGDVRAAAGLWAGGQQCREAGACAQVDEEADALAEQPPSSPGQRANARNMCYIIFTSGSTGRPKGAVLQHDSAVNFLHFIHRCAHARVLAETPA